MNLKEIVSVSIILFSIIDIIGNIPIIIKLKKDGNIIEAGKATLVSGLIMFTFLFMGAELLKLFNLDVHSFAIAGALVIFLIGLEMILGREIMKSPTNIKKATVFPLAFPLIAGAGTLTTIISLRAEYKLENIVIGIIVNLLAIYLIIRSASWIQNKIGEQGEAILHKAFGIILIAISIKLFKSNWDLM